MANLKLGGLITQISGKIGGQSLANLGNHATIKNITQRNKKGTQKQLKQRFITGTLSNLWQFLSAGQRADWETAAADYKYFNNVGVEITRNGFQTFSFCNQNLILIGQNTIQNAPAFVPVTNPTFTITQFTNGLLVVSGTPVNAIYTYALFAVANLPFGRAGQLGMMKFCGTFTYSQVGSGVNVLPAIESVFNISSLPNKIALYLVPINTTTGNRDLDPEIIDAEIEESAGVALIIYTTSTNAAWTPIASIKTGNTLHWEVTGDAAGSYDANKPTIDLSGNTGTAIITVTSADNLANWTQLRLFNLGITYIDTSQVTSFTRFDLFSDITTSIDLSTCVALANIQVYANNLSTLNVSTCVACTTLACYSNANLQFVDVSALVNLTSLNIGNTNIDSIDLSNNTGLTSLAIANTPMTSIDISMLAVLASLPAAGNNLTDLDISNNPLLKVWNVGASALPNNVLGQMLLDQDAKGLTNGNLNWNGLAPPATLHVANDVLTAYNNLNAAGYALTGSVPA